MVEPSAVEVAMFSGVLLSSAEDFADASNLRRPEAGLWAQIIEPSGFPCSEHKTITKDGFILGIQRVSSNSGNFRRQRGPPVLLIHGLFVAGDAWFLDTPNQSLGSILANLGLMSGLVMCEGHAEVKAMYLYQKKIGSSGIGVGRNSQGTIISLASFTQPDIVEMVGAAALLCPIAYLKHITARLPLKLVKMHLDQVMLEMGIHQLNFKSDWGTPIMDMMCNGHVDCDDLLTSITSPLAITTCFLFYIALSRTTSSKSLSC